MIAFVEPFNGKMSDVSAAFVLDRWQASEAIRDSYRAQFDRLARLARELGAPTVCFPCHSDFAALNDEDLRRTMRVRAGVSRES